MSGMAAECHRHVRFAGEQIGGNRILHIHKFVTLPLARHIFRSKQCVVNEYVKCTLSVLIAPVAYHKGK